jgi:hypothetical protein
VKKPAALLVAVVLTLSARAAAEPAQNLSPMACRTEGGSDLRLPPGRHVSEAEWSLLNAELRTRGDRATRLDAENRTLREEAGRDRSVWATLLVAVVAFGAGAAVTALR